jgi:hypothetical protein
VLKGTDAWSMEDDHRGSTADKSFEFEHLKPHSSYILFLYARNQEGNHNIDLPFRLRARTAPDRPSQPRNLTDKTTTTHKSKRLITWLPPYPPTGEVRMYTLRWKSANSSDWEAKVDIFPGDDLCPDSAVVADPRHSPVCHVVSNLASDQNYTFQVSSYNEGISDRSSWSALLHSGAATDEAILGMGKNLFIVVVVASLVGVLLSVLLFTCLSYHCSKKRRTKYRNVPQYVPAASTFTAPTTISSTLPYHGRNSHNMSSISGTSFSTMSHSRNSSQNRSSVTTTNGDSLRKYQHHLLPVPADRTSKTASIQEQPLPPVPRNDHLYEELKLKKEPSYRSSGEFQRPTGLALRETSFNSPKNAAEADCGAGSDLDDSDYLAPRAARGRKASTDTIDVDEYLKPTFDRFEHIDPTDMSPPREAPPPIPAVSYGGGINN